MSEGCANCHHGIRDHDLQGCKYGRATPEGCTCPFEYDADDNRFSRGLPVLCQAKYTIASGTAVPCIRQPDHPGEHEGYYPGDSHRSHWKDRPVIQAAPDEPRCNSHHRDAPGDQRCIRPAEHPAEHRMGVGPIDFCWYSDADGAYEPVANPNRTTAREEQVGGNHYRQFKIQPWDVIDEYGLDFYRGNVVKYLLRAGHKGVKLEDLKKARHYLDRVIEIEEGK